jgi:hypothetical protein
VINSQTITKNNNDDNNLRAEGLGQDASPCMVEWTLGCKKSLFKMNLEPLH